MNTNLFQTIMTVVMLICGALSAVLLSLGCTEDVVSHAMSCSSAHVPTEWVPYLSIAATVIGTAKMILAAFEGKLTAPTVPVSKSPSQ